MKRLLCLFPALAINIVFAFAQQYQLLPQNLSWTFGRVGQKEQYPASVPGNVHDDLMRLNLIPNPDHGNHEAAVQWVDSAEWEYRCRFKIDKDLLNFEAYELLCSNLDTYADVYLNDHLLVRTDNQFRIWKLDVKNKLTLDNELRIVFHSASKMAREAALKYPYTFPGEDKVFVRKAQYQFGWDWGPKIITCGIGKVELKAWNIARITDIRQRQHWVDPKQLELAFDITVEAQQDTELLMTHHCTSDSGLFGVDWLRVQKGSHSYTILVNIKNPKLWWSNGLGEAFLYDFTFRLANKNLLIDTYKLSIGLRKIEWVQEPDAKGKSFYCKLNGVPVFMKGANYIPPGNYINAFYKQAFNYEEIVEEAKNANMNMLRVWGGGVYAPDAFYEACDKNGILVWQDFMFACAMYPADSAYLSNVKAEARDQIIRIRNHPSLAIWCGNNEVDEGWKNWGWQKQYKYARKDSSEIAQAYQSLFLQTLPNAVNELAPETFYWPSSPSIGWGHPESLTQGDAHYWGVWWGMEPFEKYIEKTGRFMSEYGFQGMPSIHTYEKFMYEYPAVFDSAAYMNHQKHPTGYQTIQSYMVRDYRIPDDFESYIYVSQLLQAEGMKIAIEHHRMAKPYCMGTLFWQLNDCWPVSSWSSMDYEGRRKAAYYQEKRSFEPLLVSFKQKGDSIEVYLVSDINKPLNGEFTLSLHDFEGNEIARATKNLAVEQSSSTLIFSYKNINDFVGNADYLNPTQLYLMGTFKAKDYQTIAHHFLLKPKDLYLPSAKVKIKWMNDTTLMLISKVLVKDLYLYTDREELNLSDNYFDLLPGQKKVVYIQKATFRKTLPPLSKKEVKYKSLINPLIVEIQKN